MAGDRDLTFRAGAEVQGAVAGAQQVQEAIGGIKKTVDQTTPAVDELGAAFADAEGKVKKLADPNLSPRALQRAILDADLATEKFAKALNDAKSTGGPIPPGAEGSVKNFEKSISSATTTLGKTRDAMGDIRAKSDLAGQGLEKMSQYGGSAQGMLQGLADTGGILGGTLGKVGLAAFGVAEAFKVGYGAGEQLRNAWKEWYGTDAPNLSKAIAEWVTGANEYSDAEARAGVITQGRLSQMHTKQQAVDREIASLAELIPQIKEEQKAIEEGVQTNNRLVGVLRVLENAGKDSKEWMFDHAKAIYDKLKPAVDAGKLSYDGMSKVVRDAYEQGKRLTDGTNDQAKALEELTKKVGESVLKTRERAAAEKTAAQDARDAAYQTLEAKLKALREENLSDEEYSKRKKILLKENSDAVDAANDKEKKANKELAESIAKLSDETKGGAEAVKGLTDKYVEDLEKKKAVAEQDGHLKELTKALTDGTSGLSKAVDDTKPAWDGLKKDLENVKEPMKAAGDGADDLAKNTGEAAACASDLAEGMKEAAGTLTIFGKGADDLAADGGPIDKLTSKLAAARKQLLLLQQQMSDIAEGDSGGAPETGI